MPSIFRDATLVAKEKHLFELICDYELIDYRKRNIDKAIETQHYVSISRMLDITFNSAVALYFACLYDHISDAKTDGYIYIFCFPEYYSPHSNYIEDFYDDVLNSKSTKSYFKNFKVFSHSYSNDRIKAQSGGFIFFPGEVFSPINDVYYRRIRIAASDKDELKNELELMFHINIAKLFPEKDKIGDVIKQKFKEDEYTREKLSIRSEIQSCFKRISYEINMIPQIDKADILRYLRKEKEDLLMFLYNQYPEIRLSDKVSETINIEYLELQALILETFEFYAKMI